MENIKCDVVIIGGGPAGLAAAIGAYDAGAKDVIIIERDKYLGGILQQCIHNGFGLHAFGEDLSGPEYAERFITEVQKRAIKCFTQTMVLNISREKEIIAVRTGKGMVKIVAKTIILAMGCRERSRGAIALAGQRPAGIFTAGTAQRLINMEGYMPGKKVVILGSGDIGMIMARRLHLEGANVEAVVEVTQSVGGLNRNLVQCLHDFNIPLYLNHSITDVKGEQRVESVKVAPLVNGQPECSQEFVIDCDTLLLSVGLIPENELSKQVDVELDPLTNGPIVDQYFQTSVPGVFAAGNVVLVFDLVDYVSDCGLKAGAAAALFAKKELAGWDEQSVKLEAGEGIRCVVPQRINASGKVAEPISCFMRAAEVFRNATLKMVNSTNEVVYEKNVAIVRPPEMVSVQIEKFDSAENKTSYEFQLGER